MDSMTNPSPFDQVSYAFAELSALSSGVPARRSPLRIATTTTAAVIERTWHREMADAA